MTSLNKKILLNRQQHYQDKIDSLQLLMGIGSGANVKHSGEKSVLHLLKSFFKPPYCIFDVGSNVGQYIDLINSELSGFDFFIHSFEPSKYTYQVLYQKEKQNAKIKLNNMGLGNKPRVSKLFFDYQGSGLASQKKRRLDHFNIKFNQSEKVKIETLDNYCKLNKVNEIHLLKIDVEGFELDVLKGASYMLSSKCIHIVTFEFGGCNIDTRTFFQDYFYFFKNLNMNIYRITPSGYLFPIYEYRESYEQFKTTNYIAISYEKMSV